MRECRKKKFDVIDRQRRKLRSSTRINISSWKECESLDLFRKHDCRAAETYFV
jgi:hypothetical protein